MAAPHMSAASPVDASKSGRTRGQRGHLGGLRPTALTVLVGLPIAIAVIGATASRPVADDFSNEGIQTAGLAHGFNAWIHGWTSFYSMWGFLSLGAAAERNVGIGVYYPAAALVVIVLFVAAAVTVVRCWTRITGVGLRMVWSAALLVTAVFGSLPSLRYPSWPVLFGALYWQSAWLPHLAPILLLPPVLASIVMASKTRSSRRYVAAVPVIAAAGFVLAGFGFAETGTVGVAAVAMAWAVWRLRGRSEARRLLPLVGALTAGLIAGLVIVLLLPGTSARAADVAGHHLGFSSYSGPTAAFRAFLKLALSDAERTVATPALIVGGLTGYMLRRFTTIEPAGDIERRGVRVVALAVMATLAGSWVLVALGDLASYTAWWHLFPLQVIITVLAALGGWGVAGHAFWSVRSDHMASASNVGVLVALLLVIFWSSAAVGFAASAAWKRRPVIDRNLAAARAVRSGSAIAPAVWRSAGVGDIADMTEDPTFYVNVYVARWLGLPVGDFVVRLQPSLKASPLP